MEDRKINKSKSKKSSHSISKNEISSKLKVKTDQEISWESKSSNQKKKQRGESPFLGNGLSIVSSPLKNGIAAKIGFE